MCAKHIGFLIKPASSACNMRCRYCFYCDVAAHREERRARVMGWDVADAIIERALAVAPDAHVSFAFQGGERVVVGRLHIRVPVYAEAIAPHLIAHDEEHVGSIGHGNLQAHENRDG